MNLADQVRQAGVVGAGGGGFPTHVKLAAKADTVIANLHPDVIIAIGRTQPVDPSGALGILESFNVATLIKAADACAKTADIQLLEVRLAMAMGGKAFCTMTGDVASVQAAVAPGREVIAEAGVLVNAVVIPRPHRDVYREVV